MSCAGPEPLDSAIAFLCPHLSAYAGKPAGGHLPPPSASLAGEESLSFALTAAGTSRLQPGYLPGISREDFMRSLLLWAIGIPLPIIIILWLVTGHA
jgi:hypothetical protein